MGEICIKCGSLLEDDYLFCGLCGLKRDKNTNSVPSAEKEPGGNDKIEASQTTSNANGAVREQKNTKSQNFLCPNCRTDMPVPVRTGFGMNKRIICSACGISFLKVGADKYRLMSFNNILAPFWQKYRNRTLTVKDWDNIRLYGYYEPHKIKKVKIDRIASRYDGLPVHCTVIGASGWEISQGSECLLIMEKGSFRLNLLGNTQDQEIPFEQLVSIDISGPGTETSDLGIWGGGFGLKGAAKGILVANAINHLTRTSTTNTFIHLVTLDSEMFLHTSEYEPAKLRIDLSPAFVALKKEKEKLDEDSSSSLIRELKELHFLFQSGVLTDDEFREAKRKIISHTQSDNDSN